MEYALDKCLYSIADKACTVASNNAFQSGLHFNYGPSRSMFYPIVHTEKRQVGVGLIDRYHYLIYQENGFATFPMKALYSKTIPIMGKDGHVHYVKCTNINQFRSGSKVYWVRGIDGQLIPETKQRRSWVHPGLPPKHFMADAVTQCVAENQSEIDRCLLMRKHTIKKR